MANGSYIGKISALVTASTADLSRKLQGSTREVGRFANSVQSTIASASRSAEKSLNGIFTPLQRIERAIQFGRNARLNLGLTDQDVRRIQQAVSVSEGLNRPLASASRSFQRLSSDVGAAFLPSLIRAQEATERVNAEIATTGGVTTASFNAATRSVEQTTEAIRRLAEAESIIGRGPQGSALQFAQPQLFSALQSSAAARNRAAQPGIAERVGSDLGRAAQEVTRLDGLLAAAAARIESLRITPQVDTSALERAQGEYQDLLALQRGAVGELNRLSGSDDDAEFDAFVKSQQEQLRLERSLGDAAQQRAAEEDKVFQSYVRQQQQAKRLEQTLADLDPAERVRSREQAEAAATRRRDEELRVIEGRRTDLGGRLAEQGRRRVRGQTGDINIDSNARGPDGFSAQAQRDIDALGARVGAVRQQLETLPNSVRTRFVPELQRARDELIRLQNAPRATAQAIDAAAQRVKRLEDSARRAAAAFALPSFSEFTERLSTQRAVGELDALQQVLVQIGATAGGPAAQSYERYRARLQEAISTGTIGLPRVRRELVKLQAEAAKTAAATGRISFRGALRSIQRGGDIGRAGFQNFGLAAQQAAFAVEDFFSVTGGLDQRLRAAGNNISQLGFLLQGTTGLFVGIGAVLAAQVIPPLVRWAFETDKAEERQKQLEAAIKAVNTALERQASLTESIAEAFRTASEAAADLGASQEAQEANRRRREVEDIRQEQRDRRSAIVEVNNEAVSGRRGRIDRLQERLGTETDGFRRVRIQRQIARLESEITGIVEEAERTAQANIRNFRARARRSGQTVEDEFRSQIAFERRALESRLEARSVLRGRGIATPETDRTIAELERDIANLEVALQTFTDEATIAALERQQTVADRIERAGGRVGELTFTRQAGDRVQREFESLAERQRQGQITQPEFDAAATRLESLSRTIDLASVAVGGFQRALDAAGGALARTVAQDSLGRADTLRRQANQAEARFGPDAARTGVARQAADAAAQAANEAVRRRIRLEDSINRERSEFDRSILEGRADPFVQGLANEIRRLEEAAANPEIDPRTREAAGSRAELLNQQLQEVFQSLPSVENLRQQADQGDVELQRQIRQDEDIARGLELLQPATQLAETLRQLELAADATAEAIANRFGGRVDLAAEELARLQQPLADARGDALRQAAPAIFSLTDSVQNAVLAGPSRAALQATDVSSVQGSGELNRLLRGDDPARDQNLVELRRQSKILDDMLAEIRNNNAQVAQ